MNRKTSPRHFFHIKTSDLRPTLKPTPPTILVQVLRYIVNMFNDPEFKPSSGPTMMSFQGFAFCKCKELDGNKIA